MLLFTDEKIVTQEIRSFYCGSLVIGFVLDTRDSYTLKNTGPVFLKIVVTPFAVLRLHVEAVDSSGMGWCR